MRANVQKYVGKCKVCQHAKGRIQNFGIYTTFPTPRKPCDSVDMDFFLGLLRMQQGKDFILVIVDTFAKMALYLMLQD